MFDFWDDLQVSRTDGKLTGRDTLDTATTSETSDGWLGDTLDVVTKNLAVTLGTTLSEAFATFSACIERRRVSDGCSTREDASSSNNDDDHDEVECKGYSRPVMLMESVWDGVGRMS